MLVVLRGVIGKPHPLIFTPFSCGSNLQGDVIIKIEHGTQWARAIQYVVAEVRIPNERLVCQDVDFGVQCGHFALVGGCGRVRLIQYLSIEYLIGVGPVLRVPRRQRIGADTSCHISPDRDLQIVTWILGVEHGINEDGDPLELGLIIRLVGKDVVAR